jgi:hypothetical protein
MKQSYNIVLESSSGSGNLNNKQFYVDWGRLPDGCYKVSFVMNCAVGTTVNTYVANVFCDLGQNNSTIMATTNLSTPRTGFLGLLQWSGTGANYNLYAGTNTNVPIYISQKPSNNLFYVEIHQNTDPYFTNVPNAVLGAWTLVLTFEKQPEALL